MNNAKWARCVLIVAAVVGTQVWATAPAFEYCGPPHYPSTSSLFTHWVCACGGTAADGGVATLGTYCIGAGDSHGPNVLAAPAFALVENSTAPGGDFQCCVAATDCETQRVINNSSCIDDRWKCTVGQPCNVADDPCSEGTCVVDQPLSMNVSTGTYSGGGTKCVSTGKSKCASFPSSPLPAADQCRAPDDFGDPVRAATLMSNSRMEDARIRGSIANLTFERSYVGSDYDWAYQSSIGARDEAFMPKPFGSRALSTVVTMNQWLYEETPPVPSMRWSHNYYSFVYAGSWTPGMGVWLVRDQQGAVTEFVPCSDGTSSCFASPSPSHSSDTRNKLYFQATGGGRFIYFVAGGSRYVYEDIWTAADGGSAARYFLSRIEDGQYPASGQSPRVLATLTYAAPDAGTPCPGLSAGPNPGVPYLDTITNEDGAKLRLRYTDHPTYTRLTPGHECVIDSIGLMLDPHGGSSTETTLVRYTYEGTPDAGYSGVLASALRPETGTLESYSYTWSGGYPAWRVTVADMVGYSGPGTGTAVGGALSSDHRGSGVGDIINSMLGPHESRLTNATHGLNCKDGPGKDVCRLGHKTTMIDSTANAGNGSLSAVPLYQDWAVEDLTVTRTPRTRQIQETCNSGTTACVATSQGMMAWEWKMLDGGGLVDLGFRDKKGVWTAFEHQLAGPTVPQDAGFLIPSELRTVSKGATDYDGGQALERSTFAYEYGGTTQPVRAWEQLTSSVSRTSTLNPSATTETLYKHDLATNRLVAVITKGLTTSLAGSTSTKYVGTFYFTQNQCSSGSADPLGRVLEIHGPCFVSSATATDCDQGGLAPIAQYQYWASSETSNRANRLRSVRRYPETAVGSSCSSVPVLETTFDSYDARGNPTSVTDPNGVATTYTYEDGRVKTVTVGGQTTTYAYDHGRVTSVQHPEGNYDVWCYRSDSAGLDCSPTRNWSDRLQWRAKSSSPIGATWSERVDYSYYTDGTVSKEIYKDSGSATRRVVKYAVDAHRRPVWENSGDQTGQFSSSRLFDGADNLVGVGLAFNSPPASCGGIDSNGAPVSPLCQAFSYDRAQRLIGVDARPNGTDPAARTCFEYDAQGNVKSVATGCSATSTPGDCSTCTSPKANYVYDDFGNLGSANLPWMGTGSGGGTIRYVYDAAGNLTAKVTPAMASGEQLEYSYDQMGRLKAEVHRWTSPTPGSEDLYRLAYDQSDTSGCYSETANTLGRLLKQTDSFGVTWYKYDVFGRVTKEVRVRAGETSCNGTPNANPHTSYAYSANGNPTSITYPYGRQVTYVYDGGVGFADRVTEVDVSRFLADGGTATVQAITQVKWEPFGDLRGYQINHPDTGTASAVEYLLGDNGSTPPTAGTCPTTVPSVSNSDHTGRLRRLWVSTGAFTPGSGNGALYNSTYTWSADQIVQTDTCVNGSTTPQTDVYTYDRLLRVKTATRPTGNFAATGGAIGSRSYSYDARGSRTTEADENCSYNLTYASSPQVDRLTRRASACSGSIMAHDYTYDADGRLTSKDWNAPLWPSDEFTMDFESGPGGHGALETVMKSVSVAGSVYNYYYDRMGRRRAKVYPLGYKDEYFYDGGRQIFVDGAWHAQNISDEYVWLGGRPVVLVRGSSGSAWGQRNDSGTCSRDADGANCGFYFPVSDQLPKVVLMLDGSRRIAGVGSYGVFGHVNRVSLEKETPHPYGTFSGMIAQFGQPENGTGLKTRYRVFVDRIDTFTDCYGGDACCLDAYQDSINFANPENSAFLGGVGAGKWGWMQSNWLTPSSGTVEALLNNSGHSYCATVDGVCQCPEGGVDQAGVVLDSYEYQRYEQDATPMWTPIRFPGQYYDPETDLYENWHRYYDPSVGGYLQTEPMLQSPDFVRMRGLDGKSILVYAYSSHNPVNRFDPDGRWDMTGGTTTVVVVTRPDWVAAGLAGGAAFGAGYGVGYLICEATGNPYCNPRTWFPSSPKAALPAEPSSPADGPMCGGKGSGNSCDDHYVNCLRRAWPHSYEGEWIEPDFNDSDSSCAICWYYCNQDGGRWPAGNRPPFSDHGRECHEVPIKL